MTSPQIKVLLADDDKDDCLFFKDALAELPLATSLTIVNAGEQLMQYLENNSANLPDALFLDLNMPRKNGFECLRDIKKHLFLKTLPIIIFSTSYDEEKANELYENGAYYYICKPADFGELKKVIHHSLNLLQQNNLQPAKDNFLITKIKTAL